METRADVVVIGGGTGGCSAALAAARSGCSVLMTEECDWIGGQFTSQGVPPDEHGWIESRGCTRSYRRLRDAIRGHYRSYYPLAKSAPMERLNPGNGWVSPLCHEPRVSHTVLRSMLAPHETAGRLRIWAGTRPLAADVDGDHLRSVTVSREGANVAISGQYFIDATESGELLPLTRTEFVTGAESHSETGEPSAGAEARPANCQAFSWCFAMEHRAGEDNRIARPERYAYWRDYVPRLQPAWTGKLFSWTACNPRTLEPVTYTFEPHNEVPRVFAGLWSYRRLLDRSLFEPGAFGSDICLVNWPLIDYMDGVLNTATPEQQAQYLAEAREMSLCLFYWLQHDAPRVDGGTGWPGLKLAGAALGTDDGFAQAPYLRESRRIRALRTIVEQDVSAEYRPAGSKLGASYEDSAGIGYYRIDLHPSTGGDNYIDVPALPFQIPLSALIPRRTRNLLPACKNIGTTHITNGCYRLHPVEWNIGEAAGLLAAWSVLRGTEPHAVAGSPGDFLRHLEAEGIERAWPVPTDLASGDAHIHAR
jgi:hypothetical protein